MRHVPAGECECESCGRLGATPTLCEGDEIADLCERCIELWRSPAIAEQAEANAERTE